MEINQVIRDVSERNIWELNKAIQKETTELNKKGYELTAISTNWNNSFSSSCAAFLVFTKKL